MAVATFLYLRLQTVFQVYFILLFLWPLIFAYSRIYLGLHYPIDILCGYLFGVFSGTLWFIIYKKAQKKYFPVDKFRSYFQLYITILCHKNDFSITIKELPLVALFCLEKFHFTP